MLTQDITEWFIHWRVSEARQVTDSDTWTADGALNMKKKEKETWNQVWEIKELKIYKKNMTNEQ